MSADFDDLLRRAVDYDDRTAYERTIGRLHDPIWDYAFRRSGSESFADDVLGEVVAIVFAAARGGRITSPAHLEGFAFTTAPRVCSRQFKAQGRSGGHDQLEGVAGSDPGGYEEAEQNDRDRLIRQAVAELDEDDRAALAAISHERMSNAELGRRLGLSEQGAGTRKHRALNQLHAILQRIAPSLAAEYPRGGGRPTAKPRA